MVLKESNYRWVVLSIFVVSQFVLSIAGFGWGPLAPFFKKIMALNSTQIGLISSSFYFTSSMSAFPAGIAVDHFGVKRGVLLWLGLTGIPLIFLSFIHNYLIFLIVAAIAGLGYGMGNPVASKGLFLWFCKKTRGTAFGIRQAAVTAGGAAAGVLLVYISEKAGPFMAIRVVSLMIMMMMILSFFLYKSSENEEKFLNNYNSKESGSEKYDFYSNFTNTPLMLLSFFMAMLGLGQGVVITFLVLYMNEELGYSLLYAGSFLTVLMIGGAAGRVIWGIVSDRLFNGSRKPVLLIIAGQAAISVTALACWGITWPKWLFVPVVFLIGMSSVGWNSIGLVTVAEISAGNKTGSSVGLASTIAWGGIFISPMLFGSVTDHFGYFPAWISLAIFCVLAFLLCIFIPIVPYEE